MRLSVVTAMLAALVSAAAALGYWTVLGSGDGGAGASTLGAPVLTASSPATGTAHLSWTAAHLSPANPTADTEITYGVERKPVTGSVWAAAAGTCAGSLPSTTLACDDHPSATDDYDYRVVATLRSWTATGTTSVHVVVNSAPWVTSMTRVGTSSASNAASVQWTVVFSEAVTGVNTADFSLVRVGLTGTTAVTGVTPGAATPSATFTVTASTGTGSGLLQLNLVDDDTIRDGTNLPLGDISGGTNGNFTGEAFTIDRNPPVNALSLTAQTPGGSALLTASNVVFYRGTGGGSGGSFRIRNAVTDTGGAGPASSATAALAGTSTGWAHAPATVSTPAGGPYDSNTFTWSEGTSSAPTEAVTGRDEAGNQAATSLTFRNDSVAPAGGAVTVNGVAASAAGSESYSTDTSFTITARSEYSENQNTTTNSGLQTSALVREQAPLVDDVCGTWTGATTIVGTPAQNAGAGIVGGTCFRYRLTGVDNLGNTASVSTVVKVDTTAPAAPTLSIANAAGNAYYPGTGSVVFYRGASGAAGSFDVTASSADAETGVAFTFQGFPSGWSTAVNGATRTYSYTGTPTSPGTRTVTATNGAGLTAGATFTVANDTTSPAGGALAVNGTAATAGGSTSFSASETFSIGTRTDYAENGSATASGLAASTLVRQSATLANNTCGSFGTPETVDGSPTQSGLANG
ncbi:MAG TPA: hypothetical protein VJ689_05460, partial [Gaiellaceae bacterium]|nr:hypothetical protein [Gaiellaceae bacterium]